MAKPDGTLMSRKADAGFDRVELNGLVGRLGGWKAKVANGLTRQITGGDWVGGHAHLTADAVHFEPDFLHRIAIKDADTRTLCIPLSDVKDVTTRWVLARKAVDIHMGDGAVVSLVCEGATRFADAIRQAAARKT